MARIAIVGDGPAGLSAALFLAKNGHDATVYGTDGTAVHHARPDRSQVVISAGAVAVAAPDVLAREAGEDVHDWDSLEDEE